MLQSSRRFAPAGAASPWVFFPVHVFHTSLMPATMTRHACCHACPCLQLGTAGLGRACEAQRQASILSPHHTHTFPALTSDTCTHLHSPVASVYWLVVGLHVELSGTRNVRHV